MVSGVVNSNYNELLNGQLFFILNDCGLILYTLQSQSVLNSNSGAIAIGSVFVSGAILISLSC